MSVGTQPELLERDAEVEELTAALEDARAGHGRLVVIEGAAGIGKTRLLRVVREVAEAIGMSVLNARGTELERDFPFAIVRQLLEPALAAEEPERRTELLAGAARPAGAVLGIDQPAASGDVDPSFGTLHALYWLVSNVAESRPTVLAVDDAHWADAASLRCLRFLLTRLEDLPVLLAVAARPPDPGAHADVLAALSADPAADVLRPRELTGPAVAELVRATLAPDAHDEFCAACAEATGGNPFLLRELLRELVTEGSAGSAAEAQRVRDVAPASISRSILLRLARLGAPAAQLAAAIAVLGDDASLTHATELAGLERPDALEAADVLAAAGIVEPERPLRFVHPVIRNAIHADLAAGERAAAHERAARILGREHEAPERVAVHLLATDPAGDAQVAETLHAAGTRAIERAAPEAAVRYLRRALEEAPPTPLRRAILQSLLVAGFRAADLGGAGEEEAFVELTSEPELLVQSATAVGLYLIGSGRIPEMEALLERAATLAAEAGDPEGAMLFEAQRVTWSQRLPREAYERLAPYAGQVAPGSAGERLWLGAGAWWKSFAPGAAATEAAELAERAVASGDIFDETAGLPQAAQATLVLIRAERLTAAEAAVERFLSVARARGATPEIAGATYLRAELSRSRGDIARAVAEARAAVDAGRQGQFLMAFPIWSALLIELLIETAELDEAEREYAAFGLSGPLPETYWFTPLLFARGRLRLAQGRAEEAAEDLLNGARQLEGFGIVNTYYPWSADAALALAASGRAEEAGAILDAAAAPARVWAMPGPVAALLRARGLIEGGEDGLRLLAEAVEVAGRGAPGLGRMYALADYGAALRRANRRAEAREPLRAALDLARRGGAIAVARRAAEELAATGERVRPLEATGVESLTPSERRVAALAAEGQTNREIAQALFLTVKTVETHLSNAYRKLDIRSRRDLARALSS